MENLDFINHKLQKYKIKLENAYKNGLYDNIELYQMKYNQYVDLVGGHIAMNNVL
jgi:hypothetical protein